MIGKIFFHLLTSALLGAVGFLQAEGMPIETTEHHLIHKIVENQDYCVAAFDGDKIFICPENILSTGQGLFIDLNGSDFFPLPLLQFSRNGHFIEGNFMRGIELVVASKEEAKGPCPNCNVNTGKYGHCKNPKCEFYGLRVL